LPTGARVQIMTAPDDEGQGGGQPRQGADPTFSFAPGTGPGGYGCFQFGESGPAPGETAMFKYRAGIVIDE